ncbi:SulP family inorganic anion transporter, partial [Rhizobium ruizarguesonis]
NLAVGGRSQAAGLVSAVTLIATLLFLNGALRILPIPALSAILAAAAISLIDVSELRKIWHISRAQPDQFLVGVDLLAGARAEASCRNDTRAKTDQKDGCRPKD